MFGSRDFIRFFLLLSANVGLVRSTASLNRRDTKANPKPIVVAPSQDFKGNDGPWSTFTVQIGVPPQNVQVLISTAGYQTIAVLPGGCISSDGPTCAADRGDLFNPNSSTTWRANTVVPNSTFTLNLGLELGYRDNGFYGYDAVQLGWQGSGGPSLDQQIVAGIETKDFFLGVFGLNPRPTNFSTFNVQTPSYMASLVESNQIPSLSWAYTAGNRYRSGNVLGSLTLGGYDNGRFIPNDVSFDFNAVDAKDLTVLIQNITVRGRGGAVNRLSQGRSANIAAFIDSTTPYVWLPESICEAFEDAFGLTWNDIVQAYLINEDLHDTLLAQGANITFTLGQADDEEIVEIVLPYAAFDLNSNYPLPESRYFPLMRATNSSQYTLGRAFLQEAYVIADYECRKFSVHQTRWPLGPENIVAISPGSHDASILTPGAIAGIVIGSLIALAALLTVLLLFRRRKRGGRRFFGIGVKPEINELDGKVANFSESQGGSGVQEIDGYDFPGTEIDGTKLPGYEIDGHKSHGHELEDNVYRHELYQAETIKHEMPA